MGRSGQQARHPAEKTQGLHHPTAHQFGQGRRLDQVQGPLLLPPAPHLVQHLAEHGVLRGVLEARACRPAHRPQPPGVGGRQKVCESDFLVVLQAADVLLKNAHELVQGGVVQDQVLGVHVGQRLRAGLGRLLPQAEELRRRRLAPPGRQRGGGPGGRGVGVGGELRDGLPQLEGGGRQLFEGLEHGAAQHLLLACQDREGDPRQLLLAEGRAVGPTG